ncbi:isocitrate/isopropylmalate dehydrogenase family protein [Pseudochelatococcus sp. B33]
MVKETAIKIAVLPGDGIGPEIMDSTVAVLEAAASHAGLPIQLTHGLVGWKAYEATGSTLPPETLEIAASHQALLVGPTFAGEYPKDDPVRGHPNGLLRRRFNLFANVRPVEAWPQFDPLVQDLSITVLRENTEGFYPDRNLAWGYGEFKPTEDVSLSLRVITKAASDRFARFCFEYTRAAGEKRISIIHKRTALPQTEGLFIGAFEELQSSFPDIGLEIVRVDTFSSSFPRDPERFKIVATTNLFGDILSDQASGLAGGVGMAPSLNAGHEHAMAQAVHGTAPDIAGKDIANPSALILSTSLLLRWLYQKTGNEKCRTVSRLIDDGVRRTIEAGIMPPDLGGKAGTKAFTEGVIQTMQRGETAQAV